MDEKATQLHAIASLKVILDATKPHNGAATSSAANHVNAAKQETMLAPSSIPDMPNGVANALTEGISNLDAVSNYRRRFLFVSVTFDGYSILYFRRSKSVSCYFSTKNIGKGN